MAAVKTGSPAVPASNAGSNRQVATSTSNVLMVGPNFRVGKKIGCGNFGELRLGIFCIYVMCQILLYLLFSKCYLICYSIESMLFKCRLQQISFCIV